MTPTGRSPLRTIRAVLLIVAVLVGTVVGGWRAASMAATTKPAPSTLVVNGVSYTVAHAEQVTGLSDEDLGGVSHGIQSLVSEEKALVTVTLVATAGDSPTSYDARTLRAFATGSSTGTSPAGGTLARGQLTANGSVEGTLSFVVPRNGAKIALRAPGYSREIPLLQVDKTLSGASKEHHPSGAAKPKDPSGAAKHPNH